MVFHICGWVSRWAVANGLLDVMLKPLSVE